MGTPRSASRLAATLVAALALTSAAGAAQAHEGPGGNIGLGVGVGAPTGLSLEVALGHQASIELAIGLDAFEDAGGYMHLVYKMTMASLHRGPSVHIPFYVGIGGFAFDDNRRFDDTLGLGVRVPVGMSFDFQRAPVQAFVELALEAGLVRFNDDDAGLGLGLGAYAGMRWWF